MRQRKKQRPEEEDHPLLADAENGGILNEKYPGGVEGQRKKLPSEGHRILKKGNKYILEDLADSLVKMQ
jgi:hypothetical protein